MATITGSAADDLLPGSGEGDEIFGLAGDDTIDGGAGDDTIDGGDGFDWLTFAGTTVPGIWVDLSQGAVLADGHGGTDAVTGVEGVEGTADNDTLIGDGQNNRLLGGGGLDVLEGGGGEDTLEGGAGDDHYFVSATPGVDAQGIVFVPDTVIEGVDAGADTIHSASSYALPDGVEDLVLTGAPLWRAYEGTGNALGNTILGSDGGRDRLHGLEGDDTLDGRGGADRLDGGAGDDVLVWDAADTLVDGGAGTDVLRVEGATALDLTAVAVIGGVEVIDLAGDNLLRAAATDVLALSSTTDTLRVDGGAGDRVATGDGGWTRIADTTVGPDTYAQYVKGGATIQVDVDANRDGIALPVRSLLALDGTDGFRLVGTGQSGISVGSAGDVNGDGYADVITGANLPNGYAGEGHVVFGGGSGFASSIVLSNLDGTDGFRLGGIDAGDQAGRSVAPAGDFNGDGYADVIVGAPVANGYVGESYVVFGKASGFDASLPLSDLDGTNGFRLDGVSAGDWSGRAVASAGDVNGDGLGDLLIGAYHANGYAGASYVVFGTSAGLGASFSLSDLDGANGFRLDGIDANDLSGSSVAAAGDVNGDGYDDLLVGAHWAYYAAGETYVVFGAASGFDPSIALSGLDGTNGFRLDGIDYGDQAGRSVASAGDVNGDGYADVIVGAWGASGAAGDSYVVFGKASGFGTSLALSALDGLNGFRLDGVDAYDYSGYSVAAAGDVNGDGFDDVIVGAWGVNGFAGATYVVFGKASGFASSLALSGLDGADGFRLDGAGQSGQAVAPAGDVNGDGYADLVIGAIGTNSTHVFFGRDFTGSVDRPGTAGNDNLVGDGGDNVFAGGLGDDTMTSDGGQDVFRGGAGDDRMIIGGQFFFDVDGGSGEDTLVQDGSGVTLDLTSIADSHLAGVEVIDLAGGGNTLVLDALEVVNLSDTSNTLRVDGGGGDAVVAGPPQGEGVWINAGTVSLGGNDYTEYHLGEVVLQVRVGIDVGGITAAVPVFQLSALDGTDGFRLDGAGGQSGFSVASAGDVDGDGYADVIVGANAASDFTGESHLVLGRASGFAPVITLSGLDGTDGFRLGGIDASSVIMDVFDLGDQAGFSVASAGDFNGDGHADFVIGAPSANPDGNSNAGESYLVFGPASGLGSNFSLSGLDGTNGFRLDGVSAGDWSGRSVASAGDINGDGFADLVVGAYLANGSAGVTCVVFGGSSSFGSAFELASLDGSNGFQIAGTGQSGKSVASAGDVNGDGYADLLVGAPAGNGEAGASYVVFGGAAFSASLALSGLDGTDGFRLDGVDAYDRSGFSVASAGDVNGDGYADVIVGAFSAGSAAGESYVVFGSASGPGSNLALSALDGTNGFRLDGASAGDRSGYSVAAAGDVNGDGFDDVIVGAWGVDTNGSYSGASYVVFGKAGGFGSSLALSALNGADGFRLDAPAGSEVGWSVASAGDVNGDGFADLIAGAIGANGFAGASYVFFGRDFTNTVDFAGTAGADSFSGGADDEVFVAGEGNDTVSGGGGADVIRGGAGDDRIAVSDAGFFDVDGGTGTDTLVLGGTGVTLDLTAMADGKLTGIEAIDLGDGGNTLVLDALELLNLSDTSNTLSVVGGAGEDRVEVADLDILDLDFDMDGGAGTDTFALGGAGLALDLATVSGTLLQNVETIDLTGTGNNTLTLTVADLLALSSTSNTLRVDGNVGDAVSAGSGWFYAGQVTIGPNDYAQYLNGGATLQVDLDVDRSGIGIVGMILGAPDVALGFRIDTPAGFGGYQAPTVAASAGDVNGDGFDDLIVGNNDGNASESGESYVVYGSATGFGSSLAASALDGTSGFRLVGVDPSDYAGRSVASAGDVNGDGLADLIIGAPNANGGSTSGAGEAYVVFAHATGFGSSFMLSSLNGANGFRLDGVSNALPVGDRAGRSVASAGDVNGDGYADVLVGAPWADPAATSSGESYVVFGAASGFNSGIAPSDLDGTNGFRLPGILAADLSGYSVASAGDVNGDGFDDIIIGAPLGDSSYQGQAFVVFGKASGFSTTLALSALGASDGFLITHTSFNIELGSSVSSAGDVNGDGYADVIVGATRANSRAGASYVIFGKASGFGSSVSVDSLDGTNGFRLDGIQGGGGIEGDLSGGSVASAGDVNGDGYDDLIVGAELADPNGVYRAGEAYLVFGKVSGFSSSLALSAIDGVNGFRLGGPSASEQSGYSVASAGDLNGDGFDDVIVGTGAANGPAYVVYGRDFNGDVDSLGTLGADSLTGSSAAEIFFGLAGDDTIVGGGGADVIRAGLGDDRIVVPDLGFHDIRGGHGFDTLALDGSGINLDLSAIADTKLEGIEAIDLAGSGNNTLTLKLSEVLKLSDSTDTLFVRGDSGDTVTASDGGWSNDGTTMIESIVYDVFTKAQATVYVEDAVNYGGFV